MKYWWQPERPLSYQEKAFHEFFYDAVVAMEACGILVLDMMPGVSFMVRTKNCRLKINAVVSVSWMGSWKNSLFVLLHELGHVASVRVKSGQIIISLRKSPSSEKAANTTACNILIAFGFEDMIKSYVRMYNEINSEAIKAGLRKPFKTGNKKP